MKDNRIYVVVQSGRRHPPHRPIPPTQLKTNINIYAQFNAARAEIKHQRHIFNRQRIMATISIGLSLVGLMLAVLGWQPGWVMWFIGFLMSYFGDIFITKLIK